MVAKEVVASKVPNGESKAPNRVDCVGAESLDQNSASDGPSALSVVIATSSVHQGVIQQLSPSARPTNASTPTGQSELSMAPRIPSFGSQAISDTTDITISTPLPPPPSFTVPSETPNAVSASFLFRSSGPSGTPDATPTPSMPPVAGSSSLRAPTLNDDEDEPMPQIDLTSDTDEAEA
jgi:hypothetical protein